MISLRPCIHTAIVITTLVLPGGCYGQVPRSHATFQGLPAIGYYWQAVGTCELRWRTLYYTRRSPHENISFETSVALFSRGALYAAPQAGVKYYRPIFIASLMGRLAVSPRCSYWMYFTEGRALGFITPELGFTWDVINLSYGFNLALNGQRGHVSAHRLALRLEMF